MRPQTQRLGLRLGIVAGANSSAMSIDVALSTHYGARRNTAIILRASRLAPRQELSATSMDMALLPAAIFLFYGFGHAMLAGADLLFATFCCIFALQKRIRASTGPFFRVLKALPRLGRPFFLSPKQENQSPKSCRRHGRPSNRSAKQALFTAHTVKLS